MSRTKKQKPAPGKEYWSRRPGNRHGSVPGKVTKAYTHAVERQQGKGEVRIQDTVPGESPR